MTTVPVDTTSSQPLLNLTETRTWIESFYADSPHLLHISSTSDWRGACFAVDQRELLLAYVARLDRLGVQGVYLRACTLGKQPTEGRGSDDDSVEFPGFWADMDLAGPGHKTTKNLPPDVESCKWILKEARLPEPTVWVHSGGGAYPWWMLRNLEPITDQNRDALRNLSAEWHDLIHAGAQELGWHYGIGTHDLSRVLRLPGTVNRKVADDPRPCRIMEWGGPLYELGDLNSAAEAARSFLEKQQRAVSPMVHYPSTNLDDDTPFNSYERRTDWADILIPEGWTLSHTTGSTRYWTRPGKRRGEGHSATTGHDAGRDRLFVFSTETVFNAQVPYTKPAAYALLHHGGDFKAAARTLASLGFGGMRNPPGVYQDAEIIREPSVEEAVNTPQSGGDPPDVAEDETPPWEIDHNRYPSSDLGNAKRMAERAGGRFRYVAPEKAWYHWNGHVWQRDRTDHVMRLIHQVSEDLQNEAKAMWDTDRKGAKKLYAFAMASQGAGKCEAAVRQFRALEDVTIPGGTFNAKRHLLNLKNVTINLEDFQVTPHNSANMLSNTFNANYDPAATAPEFLKFIERAFPDEATRDYVQRALGYSLLGDADQRVLFMLYGPSSTGKSQLVRLMQDLFGDYGRSAAASTFKSKRGETITNDLHDLRDKRFVATSEIASGAILDEELVKRITGGDTITSRALYEENQNWRPSCVLWMATNHLPQLNSDDDAMWRRVKPIAMTSVIGKDEEIGGFAENVLLPEADGILNWLLEGVRRYWDRRLTGEPELVLQSVADYKLETDSVALFINDAVSEGVLLTGPEQRIGTMHLYRQYSEWCTNNMVRPLGARRFKHRMETAGYEYLRSHTSWWVGIGANLAYGVLGTMQS